MTYVTFEIFIYAGVIGAFLALLATAAFSDLSSYRIPNRITLAIATLYPVYVLAAPVSVDWIGGLMVGGIVLAAGFALFAFKVLGGGDVKMLAAVALWAGQPHIADFLIFSALAGGLMSLFWLSPLRHGLMLTFDKYGSGHSGNALMGASLPYGVAIAIGGVVVAINLLGFGRGV
ncbi:MAG: peptidase [Rhodospirillaceae bacterium]|jgi:prepilin peptidase CpaA|nr:peptidase [Rhodospirillaceae bacterium]MBT4220614.1 peptidase [Rhodospirillaceae bacterium]MBT4464400.1 peptidase [Rhodospirillaceae bacterium]MBT5014583.1 peptidase [Rhodospirillaceae bacterium]MBT5308343.1 peptidase [Rhodospirillaceae bacterium]